MSDTVSRQRRYQRRHKENGLCVACSRPAYRGGTRCATHLKATSRQQRERLGYQPWRENGPGRPPLWAAIEEESQ